MKKADVADAKASIEDVLVRLRANDDVQRSAEVQELLDELESYL